MSYARSSSPQTAAPPTFVERGVAAPFTTPPLLGARLRRGQKGGSPDLIVPNPSGGQGCYVLDWPAATAMFRPTMHDTVLHERLPRHLTVTPPMVRFVARGVARDGLAGRAAQAAAAQSDAAEDEDRIVANFLLMMRLVEQTEPSGLTISEAMPRTAELEHRARLVITRLEPQTGASEAVIANALEALAAPYAVIGVDAEGLRARLPRLIKRIAAMAETLFSQPFEAWNDRHPELAAYVARSATRAVADGGRLIASCRTLTNDMMQLMRLHITQPTPLIGVLSRPDWLLDGWETACLLWETAETPLQRRVALIEIAPLVPRLPAEALAWMPDAARRDSQALRVPAIPPFDTAAPAGLELDLVARNEKLRALAA